MNVYASIFSCTGESKMKSFIWKYFIKEGLKARCNVKKCDKLMSCQYGSSSLAYHLKVVHGITKTKTLGVAASSELNQPAKERNKTFENGERKIET